MQRIYEEQQETDSFEEELRREHKPGESLFMRGETGRDVLREMRAVRKQILADFKNINELCLGDNFLVNKSGPEKGLLAAIEREAKDHPNSRVAIALKLAKKYPGKCNALNPDFLLELRQEKFKHERLWCVLKFWTWCKHTSVHKDQKNMLTFYRASTFEDYVNNLSPDEKAKIASEMRQDAYEDKSTSRCAEMTRKMMFNK